MSLFQFIYNLYRIISTYMGSNIVMKVKYEIFYFLYFVLEMLKQKKNNGDRLIKFLLKINIKQL